MTESSSLESNLRSSESESSGSGQALAPEPQNGKRRSVLALILSLVLPGLGHAVLGRGRRGAVWLLAFLILWVITVVVAVWWLGALVVGGLMTVLWYIACAYDAFRQQRVPQRGRRWAEFAGASLIVWMLGPLLVPLTVRFFSLEAFKVQSSAMCPSLRHGDHVWLDKTAYRTAKPAVGDVVVYSATVEGGAERQFVHRVVAVGGQKVAVKGGRVSLDGTPADLAPEGDKDCNGGSLQVETLGTSHHVALGDTGGEGVQLRVPEGHIFVLGDNRANAYDSRQAGTIDQQAISGRVTRLWRRQGSLAWDAVK